jgi:hypothetical protein
MSRSKDARVFVAALHAESQRTRSASFDKTALKRIAESIGINSHEDRFDALLESVNWQGILLMRGRGSYELQSSSFATMPAGRTVHTQGRSQGGMTQRGGRSQRGRPQTQLGRQTNRQTRDEYCSSDD